jgi:hypothetical protein
MERESSLPMSPINAQSRTRLAPPTPVHPGWLFALFCLTEGLGVFYNQGQILPDLVAEAMEKRPIYFFRLFVTLLFAFACAYTLFDQVREADLFSDNKYEERDSEGLYAEKGSNLDAVLVSPALFSLLPDTFLEFLPSFLYPNTFLVPTSSVLRC